ncbi:ABC transporter ATP-binding protein [Paraclostridium bifermentans]|uniref:ABC transporter ATP-binding protein n=1 Tax=Paraclostridium bifermentans TaxID=1490 RepID=UPI00359C2EEF
MKGLSINNIKKVFEDTVAINDVSFDIKEGEFFTFLGPSGCGKTTLLRIIAGFEKPEVGSIFIGDTEITKIQSEKREVGLVFQNYALFPHMNVYENIAYGLKIKKLSKKDIQNKVLDTLKLVRLEGYEKRKITELSGGEQQRVALARALVIEPKVLLLDEPLCNLDAKLRDEMRNEIKELQRKLRITTIFVTHDQNEALTMSQRIAIFNKGKCMQIGTPKEVYSNPKNRFIANFIGVSNIFSIEKYIEELECSTVYISKNIKLITNKEVKGKFLLIRPEHINISKAKQGLQNELKGVIQNIQFNGNINEYVVKVDNVSLKISKMNSFNTEEFNINEEVFIEVPKDAIKILQE